MQFLVEMHYKIAAAVLLRHKWHWLAVIVPVVLINIFGTELLFEVLLSEFTLRSFMFLLLE